MKKIVLAIVLAVFSLSIYATGIVTNYVVTEKGVKFYENVNYGINSYLVAKGEDGSKVKYSIDDVLQFSKDGNVYHKLDLSSVGLNNNTFLRLLKTRNGFSLYMYEDYYANAQLNHSFYIFKEGEFVFEIDEKNLMQIVSFFDRV